MRYIIFPLFLFLSIKGIAQTEHLKEFYPENKLFKKLKVKAVIDSFMIVPENSRITEYDTLGRELGSHYLKAGYNPYLYTRSGNTLTRYRYYGEPTHGPVFLFEQFIYNSKGEVLKHALAYKSYTGGEEVYAKLDVFFYNSSGLFCKIEYTNHNYPKAVEREMVISENDLKISSAIYYSYRKTSNGVTVTAKETMGNKDWRTIDTIVYDKMNRLIRRSSFSRKGVVGELGYENLNVVTENYFYVNRLSTQDFYTYCLAVTSDGYCLSPQRVETNTSEIWLNKQGLPEMEYSYYPHNGQKYLLSKYYYLFYE